MVEMVGKLQIGWDPVSRQVEVTGFLLVADAERKLVAPKYIPACGLEGDRYKVWAGKVQGVVVAEDHHARLKF